MTFQFYRVKLKMNIFVVLHVNLYIYVFFHLLPFSLVIQK